MNDYSRSYVARKTFLTTMAWYTRSLSAHYLAADPAARADSRVDLAVDASSGDPLGVALWDAPSSADVVGPLGPGNEPPPGLDPDLLGGAWELCLLDAAQCEAHRSAEPHWYLYMVAVAPARKEIFC